MSEVMAILPEFDPKHGAVSSKQFIAKIESLRSVYGWSKAVMLYAVQAKLIGHAKTWADAHEVFQTWEEFTVAFLADFPCETSMADEHLVLANTRQDRGESTIDYYYKMLTKGRRAKMDEKSIIRHIINGLLDDNIKRTCNASQFYRCSDLLKALNGMTATTSRTDHSVNKAKFSTANFKTDTKRNYQDVAYSPTCYNCRESGHISRNCPRPQKRERCGRCGKVHRRGQINCEEPVVRRVEIREKSQNIFERQVKVNDEICAAYIDSGSECHLIRQSCVSKLQLQTKYCAMELNGLWGGSCTAKEKVAAQIEIDDLKFDGELYIVSDNVLTTDVLLGRSIFDKNDIDIRLNSHGLQFIQQATVMQASVTPEKILICNENMAIGDVNPATKEKLYDLYDEFQDIFARGLENIGQTNLVEMQIELVDKEVVVVHKPYRVPEPKKDDVRKMINEMLKYDIIEESTSEYASPMILVKKKNGSDRLWAVFINHT